MTTDIKSMFDSIKGSLSPDKPTSNGGRPEFMRFKPNNTYLVRLIPNIKAPEETFLNYTHHGWTSRSTGSYVDALCPKTFGDRCIICDERFKLYQKAGGDKKSLEYQLAGLIKQHDKLLVNVYVIDDPTNPDNNGTVKVLRASKSLKDKIDLAVSGDDADEFGARVFDLSDEGCNFKIVVNTTQDGKNSYQNYNNSRFTSPSAIPNLSASKIKKVYDSIYDLKQFIERKSDEEMREMLATHLYAQDISPEAIQKPKVPSASAKAASFDVDDEEDEDDTVDISSDTKSKINDLLAGLDD